MADQIPEEVKERRWKKIMKIQQKALKKTNRRWIGKTLSVVVAGYHPESKLLMIGRHRGQCPDIDGQVIINDGRKVTQFGQVYLAEVTDALEYDLIARIV